MKKLIAFLLVIGSINGAHAQNKQEIAAQNTAGCYATTSWLMTQPSHSYLNDYKSTGQNFLNFYRLAGEHYVGKEKFNFYIEDFKKLMPHMSKSDKVGIFEKCVAIAANAVAR